MDDLIRRHVEAPGAWGAKEHSVAMPPVELDGDYAARIIALLVEQAGGRVEFTREQIAGVVDRLALLPEDAEDGFNFEVRNLARDRSTE